MDMQEIIKAAPGVAIILREANGPGDKQQMYKDIKYRLQYELDYYDLPYTVFETVCKELEDRLDV